ncbi:DinB family protein [Burkholderia stagnalis]
MTSAPYPKLLAVKQWADRGLYDVVTRNLDRLPADDATLLLRVLDHVHTVDRIFQHHLQGVPHPYRAPRSDTLPSLDTLARGAYEVDDWYVSYATGLAAGAFDEPVDFTFTSGKPARMRRGDILLHVCLHGTYHRGNAGALLQLRGLAPSRDAITDYLEDVA